MTREDRIKIEIMLNTGHSIKEVAEETGFHFSTIWREIKKGEYKHRNSDYTEEVRYSCDLGQQVHEWNVQSRSKGLKIGKDIKFVEFLENLIADKGYSPETALAEARKCKNEFSVMICTTTLYSYISKGVFLRLTNQLLPVKRKKKRKKIKRLPKRVVQRKGNSIETRPKEVENRKIFGHWEMDTVKGKRGNSKANLLVLTERKTLSEIIVKMPNGCAVNVVNALDLLELKWGDKFKKIFKTITVDNGVEFSDCASMERSVLNKGEKRTNIYYCHPYSCWERGSNENQNKLIRRHIPKGINFDNKNKHEIKYIEDWINNYPRRKFNFKTSNELFMKEIKKLFVA